MHWRKTGIMTGGIASAMVLHCSIVQAGPYVPVGSQTGSPAVQASSSSLIEWASGATVVRGLRYVANPTFYASDPNGPLNYAFYGGSDGASMAATGSSTANTAPVGMPAQPQSTSDAVALGQNGTATLSFSQPIIDGPGADFAVFGNGFSTGSQEWVKPALVEVSSNGVNFFQFPSVSLTQTATQVGSFGEVDPTNLYDLAGKDPVGWGTPFDLSELATVSPLLNVNAITAVRFLSVTGDIAPAFATYDSKGDVINSPFAAPSQVGSEGFCLAGVGVLNDQAGSGYTILKWSNAGATGTWTGGSNWNQTGVGYQDGNAVTLDNSIVTHNQTIVLNSLVSPGAVTVNNSTGSFTITGTGGITGTTGLVKTGTQKLTLATVNSYTGITVVNGGTVELAVSGALPVGTALTIAAGASVVMDNNTGLLTLTSLNLDPPRSGAAVGKLDLGNNGLVLHNGNLATITADIASGANQLGWNGSTGITSSSAEFSPSHLTSLGIVLNVSGQGNAVYSSTFDGTTGLNLTASDVLVRFTYVGDANLDGHVDGSDYSLIDNGMLQHRTGWQNGDFNYDGTIDGSDYTLIDNAFNTQGASFSSGIANPDVAITSQIAAENSVPEPAGLGLIASIAALLTVRGKRGGRQS